MIPQNDDFSANEDRRKFLAACGKFAVVTPPAVTMLLSTSLNSAAVAHSNGRGSDPDRGPRGPRGNNGWGNGGGDGSPNRKGDKDR